PFLRSPCLDADRRAGRCRRSRPPGYAAPLRPGLAVDRLDRRKQPDVHLHSGAPARTITSCPGMCRAGYHGALGRMVQARDSASAPCAVSVRGLVKEFSGNNVPAVEDVTFDVEDGELLVLLGPSGCGKTTTL